MDDRLGPRACAVCGPGGIEGCWRCGATLGHRHIVVVDRYGKTMGRVAACSTHAPSSGVLVQDQPQDAPRSGSAIAIRRRGHEAASAKRRRDRERRTAHRIVLDRHPDEVAAELARIRGEDGHA